MYHFVDFCRLCLCFKGEFSNMCNDNTMEKVVACVSDLEFDEKLPALICSKCSEQLDKFFDFRNQCLRSEFLLSCYIDKFVRTQPCNKFVNTQLKVNVLKNFATSSKQLGNVQISKKRSLKPFSDKKRKSLKICEFESTASNFSNNYGSCKDVTDSLKAVSINNNQNEAIKLNKSHSLSKPNAEKCVAGNDIDTYISDPSEDEDDVFFEEEDEETLQLENVSNGLNNETENCKRKTENSFNKKSRLETNSLAMSGESCETQQTNQAESNYNYNLEDDANFLPWNMQADITEHVKTRKRKVQIRAQEKMKQQVLNDKVQTQTKTPKNLQKDTSLFRNRNSHNSKTNGTKNAKLQDSKRSAVPPNIKINNHDNSVINTSSNPTTYNITIDKLLSDKCQNFDNYPARHSTNIDKLIDAKFQNFNNIPVTANIIPDKFINIESYSFINNLATHNIPINDLKDPGSQNLGCNSATSNIETNKIKDSELQDLEINSVFINQNIKTDKINVAQNSETSSVFVGHNIIELDNFEKNDLQNLRTDQVKDTESQNLEGCSTAHIKERDAKLQSTMTQNIEINTAKYSELRDIRNSPITRSNETDKIHGSESQNLKGSLVPDAQVDKIKNVELQNLRTQQYNNKTPTIESNESDDLNTNPLETIPMGHNIKTYNSRETPNSVSISHHIEVNKLKHIIEQKIKNTSPIDGKLGKSSTIQLQNFKQKQNLKKDLKANNNKLTEIKTAMDYEKDITSYCISNTILSSEKEISKPQQPYQADFINITKGCGTIKTHNIGNKKDVSASTSSTQSWQIPKVDCIKRHLTNTKLYKERKIPVQITTSHFNNRPVHMIIPQNTRQKLYKDVVTTNKKLNEGSAEPISSLFVQNTPFVQTNETVLTQSFADDNIIYQTVLTKSIPCDSPIAVENDTYYIQNPQIMPVTERNYLKVRAAGSLHSGISPHKTKFISAKRTYQLLRPKQNITMHNEKSVDSILKKALVKSPTSSIKTETKLSNEQFVDRVKFEEYTDDPLNVEADLIIPLYSRDTLDKNRSLLKRNTNKPSLLSSNKSLMSISNRDCIQLSNIINTDTYSSAQDTTVTQQLSNISPNSECASLINQNSTSKFMDAYTTEIVEAVQEIKLKPSLICDKQSSGKSENCDTFITDGSLVTENSSFSIAAPLVLEDCYMPHNDHNYNSNTNDSHFLNQRPSTSASSNINKKPVHNGKIKKKSVSSRMCRLSEKLRVQKKQRSKISKDRPKFMIGVEKDKDSNNLENSARDSEDSEVDVVSVSQPNSPYRNVCVPEQDKVVTKNEAERYRRTELRRNLNFLCSIIPDKVIPSCSAISVKRTTDAAICYIKALQKESRILKEKHRSELHKQNELIEKFKDIKKK